MRCRCLALAAVLLFPLAAAAAEPATAPARITSKLEDQRWQYLPVGVSDVFVGPDQRVWYVANDHGVKSGGFTRDVARDIIASEFERENPHAYPIVLFEPAAKRVWFYLFFGEQGYSLLGYDGKRWVESKHKSIGGGSGTWTRLADGTRAYGAVAADNRAFFVTDEKTITWFDGDNFKSKELPGPGRCALAPEGDGAGVIAGTNFYASDFAPEFYRWRDNQWKQVPSRLERKTLITFAATPGKGIWCHVGLSPNTLQFVPFDDSPRPAENTFGPFTFDRFGGLWGDGKGTVYAWGTPSGKGTESVLVACSPKGEFREITRDPAAIPYSGILGPLQNSMLWISGGRNAPSVLFDPATGKVLSDTQQEINGRQLAAKADGTMFVRGQDPNFGPILAYRPEQPDSRSVLKTVWQKSAASRPRPLPHRLPRRSRRGHALIGLEGGAR